MASSYFVRGALRWYLDLESEAQESWKLLRRALLQAYPAPETRTLYPRAPPYVNISQDACDLANSCDRYQAGMFTEQRGLRRTGRIRVIYSDSTIKRYVSQDMNRACTEREEALTVSVETGTQGCSRIALPVRLRLNYTWMRYETNSILQEGDSKILNRWLALREGGFGGDQVPRSSS